SDEQIDAVVRRFVGPIDQVPPMYSALKHQGQPLYKLARQGVEIDRPARRVTIYSLQWRRLDAQHLEFEVFCSKGTYIRTLVEDIGEQLACYAHVAALRRVQVGPFSGAMVTIEHLRQLAESGTVDAFDALLLPMESTLSAYPRVLLDEKDAIAFARGQAVTLAACDAAPVGLMQVWQNQTAQQANLLGVGEQNVGGKLIPRRLVSDNVS
ncbi:MAG TPA: tRNA pseudouridine(55) synthase TruB, partial [Pseudomonadales bacterium]|nr:tRNA pseudouridine(55) synthase TruB [Pseudomonadales bacterium]